MAPTFTGTNSTRLAVLVPLACMISSILFYQIGMRAGSTRISSDSWLRSDRNNHSIILPSLISSTDLNREFELLDPSSELGLEFGIPACARDVFVTLHKEVGGESEQACKGLLIRDDIIITSNECSKFDFTFDFTGFGIVQAVPHTSLNSKMNSSRLGFLEANPPYHYHFLDQPVRRTRMFLSPHTTLPVRGPKPPKAGVVMTCGERQEPIAHNFPGDDGEMVPLVELANIVSDDILWEDRDINTSPMLEFKSNRWWTRPITLKEVMVSMAQMIKQYTGPPGSVSVPAAHSGSLKKTIALFETVDPRGHRRDCSDDYFTRYRREKPFSGVQFFDWLDFGPGKFLLEDTWCKKKDFNRRKVHYFNDDERAAHEVYFEPSKGGGELIVRYKQNDELVPPSDMDDPHLYMWDLDEKFYVVDNTWDKSKYGTIKHTGVVAGKPALSAGKAYFGENGAVWGINFSSGHYRPDIQAAAMMYQWMKDGGSNLTAFHWVGRNGWSTKDCRETDWESIEIPGFNATALNQSCHEVTVNPTWILKEDVRR